MLLTKSLHDAFEILLPRCCLVCKRPLLNNSICLRCLPEATPTSTSLHDWPGLPFRSLHSIWAYSGNARSFITAMKYGPSLTLAKIAGRLLSQSLSNNPVYQTCDLVVPVPSSRKSFHKRIFNQAAVLAKSCAHKTGSRWQANALRHTGYRAPQASLATRERFQNVQNSFWANPHIVSDKTILLVDDVVTTGATISSAARALLASGAKEIHAAALAQSDSLQGCWAVLDQEFGCCA